MPTFTASKHDKVAGFLSEKENRTCCVVLVGASPRCAYNAGSLAARLPQEVFVKGCIAVAIITMTFALEQGPD